MKPSRFFMIAVCFTLSYCAGPAKFEVGTASSMTKVFFDRPWQSGPADSVLISAAGREFESFQLVIFGQHDSLRSVKCSAEGLRSDSLVISAGEITFNPVGYVRTSVVCKQYSSSLGWWPDPLLALDSFDLAPGEVQPVWVTVHVPAGTPAGIYRGTLSISAEVGGRKEIPVRLRVWSFDLPPVPSLKTLTWVGGLPDDTGFQNGRPLSYQKKLAMYDLLLSHRLGPGGNLELIDEEIGYCRERGMNVFLLAVIPNLKRTHQEDYSTEYKEQLARKLKSAVEKFGPRGWLESMAYVYNYDEVDREHWPLARQMYGLVKSVSSELKVIQCLNIPEGVRAMAGFADTWDVYIAQYEKTGVEERVAQGDEAWLAVCCYPVDRPNFFLEYPAIDGRLIGWICWRTGVSGFEYWSPNHWGENRESPQLRSNWIANTFLDYNGDGYLTYPGPEGSFLSSVRLENLRDGFEDYEYLKLLERLGGDLQAAGQVAASTTEFTSDPELLSRVREEIAVQIEKLSGSDKVR